jgi:hypothetical protein
LAEQRVWLGLTAAWSGIGIGLLIVSVFLARRGMEPTVDAVAGRALPLSVVLFGHVWSAIQSSLILCGKLMNFRQPRVFFGGILAISTLSMGGCLAALRVDDYQNFLAVSVYWASYWVMLIA